MERGDVDALGTRLRVDAGELRTVVPALSAWHGRQVAASTVESWRYRVSWLPLASLPGGRLAGTWLVVMPADAGPAADSAAAAIADGLAEHGASVVRLAVSGTDRAALAGQLRAELSGECPAGVLSLLALDDREEPGHPVVSHATAATITLLQALHDTEIAAPFWCVTSGAVAVDRAEDVRPAAGSLWGMGTVLALDYPGTWGGMVDLADAQDREAVGRLCALLSSVDGEDQLAIRQSGTFARRMVRAPQGDAAGVRRWRPRGTVLVTGGTGAVGSRVARWLAAGGAEHVVLASRSGRAARGAAELEAELVALGAQVTIGICDVSDGEALSRLLASLPQDPPLTAVVHAAGVLHDEPPLTETTPEELADIMRAKVAGAVHLDRLLADRPLDAFVLFSSGAAVWGSAGQPGYAAANAFLDGLAQRRRARGLTCTSIAWGAWAGGGMVDEAASARLRRMGVSVMDPALALEALGQALGQDESHLVVADIDWTQFAPVYTLARPRPLLRALPEVRAILGDATVSGPSDEDLGGPDLATRLASLTAAEQHRLLLELVRAHVAVVLGHDDASAVEATRAFKELGFDSVTAVDLRNRLRVASGLRLPATVVFDYANPKALAEHLWSALCQDGAPAGAPLAAELDRLEARVAALPRDEVERTGITSRLQALVLRLNEVLGGSERAAIASRLEGATAEEVFDLIDQELKSA